MNKNKILIEIYIPLIEKSYDIYIPVSKTIGTIKKLLEKSLVELTEGSYQPSTSTNLYNKETGLIYDINKKVYETDLENGSKLILI